MKPIPTGIEAKVCEDIAARQHLGISKYGMSLESNPANLKERLTHAYQESLDLSNYLKWANDELVPAFEAVAVAVENYRITGMGWDTVSAALANLKSKGWKPNP